jgi:inorganic pyrophosphatase
MRVYIGVSLLILYIAYQSIFMVYNFQKFKIFNLKNLTIQQHEEKIFFYYQNGEVKEKISPWNDIPLLSIYGNFHFICEIPKGTRKKFEISKEEFNPIIQDTENGELREYKHGDMMFNYGAFPNTWEDPKHITKETSAQGDNDPIDVIEIGSVPLKTGDVVETKVLGILALIDSNQTDWKVIAIQVSDPLSNDIDNIEDVEKKLPGKLDSLREWLRVYKVSTGKQPNTFGFGGQYQSKDFALQIIMETHEFWKQFRNKNFN